MRPELEQELFRASLPSVEAGKGGREPERLPYSPEMFVDREAQVALLTDKVEELLSGEPVRRRTVVFLGAPGIGKSWIMSHVAERLKGLGESESAFCALFDFGIEPEENALELMLDTVNRNLFGDEELTDKLPEELTDEQKTFLTRSAGLREKIEDLPPNTPVVLLLDSVFQLPWEELALLEAGLLSSLSENPNVILGLTGRGRPYPWKNPFLRLKAKFANIEPFTAEQTAEQISRQAPAALEQASAIHALSGGHPLANYALAEQPPDAALDSILAELVRAVPAEDRTLIRSLLPPLSILKGFDEERMPAIIAAYLNNPEMQRLPYPEWRKLRQKMTEYAYATWDTNTGAYTIPPIVRTLGENYLRVTNPELWRKLHAQAADLFDSWAEKYPDSQARWSAESQYHRQRAETSFPNPPSLP